MNNRSLERDVDSIKDIIDRLVSEIEEWETPKEAAKYLGLSYASEISNVALNKRKNAHGYIWKYEKTINKCQEVLSLQ